MPSTQTTAAEPIMTDNVALRAYYESWDSRVVYQIIMGGTQHFGYWDKDTYWPFPLGSKLRRMEQKLMEILALPKGSHVLDAGCGVGHVARYMAQHGMRVFGIDIIDWAIEDARKAAKDAGLPKEMMLVEKMDYHHLDSLVSESFDGVYTMQAFGHAVDPQKAMAGFFRVVRPGGRIAMVEVERKTAAKHDDPNDRLTQELKMVNDYTVMPTNEAASEDYFRKLLEEAGFVDVVVRDWQPNILPILRLFYSLVMIPYLFFRLFGNEKSFINMICARSGYAGRSRWRFVAITATKPGEKLEDHKSK
ncbi:methyltransferase type 11 [Trichoderma parareesei]|uniref:Methyltransferase type 11 n=1 Tax=Trichoderma parareesei TaxID=858221 RepID=A0A2H2YUE2_TRIPA|nr:methyltransferase type 11 [Trichoderma parareesei]